MAHKIKHIVIVIAMLILLAVVPAATHFDFLASGADSDAVSQASIVVPDQPSGDYIVLISRDLHKDTLGDWENFFTGEELAVIFEDVSCLTARGDVNGQQLAERFRAQLPENQMQLRSEDPTLLASKAEAGYIDIAVFSQEMADAVDLNTAGGSDSVAILRIRGESDQDAS